MTELHNSVMSIDAAFITSAWIAVHLFKRCCDGMRVLQRGIGGAPSCVCDKVGTLMLGASYAQRLDAEAHWTALA